MVKGNSVLDRMTTWVTSRLTPRPLKGQDLTQPTTASVPQGLLGQLYMQPYNPALLDLFRHNRLAREKGWGVLEDMQEDSQIRACSTIKRAAPTSKGWTLNAANDSPLAREIADFSRDNFQDLERPLENINFDLMESTWTGLSVSESIYRYQKGGVYNGKIMLQDIQTRPPSMVDVRFDETGRIRGVVAADIYGSWKDAEIINPFKFVIHTWQSKYGSPYGRGDAIPVYKHWWAKEFLMRAHSIYMDKYGGPSIVGRISPTMSKRDTDLFEDILKHMQHEGYAILPPDWNFDWVFPPGGASNPQAYLDAIEWHNNQIALAMLGSTLSTNEAVNGNGTFAQAKVHETTRDLILTRVKLESELLLKRQVLKRLILLNYGRDAAMQLCPKFEYSPQDLDDVTQLIGGIVQLVNAGIVDANEPWIRERLFIPPHADVMDHVADISKQKAEISRDVQDITMPQLQQPENAAD